MSTELNVKFNDSFYKKTGADNWINILKGTTRDIGLELEKELKNTKFKKPTGNLNRNHHAEINQFQAKIKNRTKYWGYVDKGTGPHTITPKTKKALYWKGAKHPVPLVNHPGIKAMNFTTAAIKKFMGKRGHEKALQNNMKRNGVV